jgi:tRNA1Val (adenine37-N6)-methyltransferase
MKVTTDACIQGAWTPMNDGEQRVLDIGAGTGLLSLMLAQRCHSAHITAIEIDEPAAAQATQNIQNSPWHQRIEIVHGDVLQHVPDTLYNAIVCNPPFFANSLKNNQQNKTIARHNVTLTMEQLLCKVTELLAPDGYFSLLLPVTEYAMWLPAAQKLGLNEVQRLDVRHHPNAPVKRVVAILAKNAVSQSEVSQLTIKDETGQYTTDFQQLLGDFYL